MEKFTHITLKTAARVFQVHPRTILRALSGQHNTYWTEDSNEDRVDLEYLAAAYNTTTKTLNRILTNRDELLTPDQAARILDIKPRTFRDRVKKGLYKKITNGGIVRYLKSKIVSDALGRSKDVNKTLNLSG